MLSVIRANSHTLGWLKWKRADNRKLMRMWKNQNLCTVLYTSGKNLAIAQNIKHYYFTIYYYSYRMTQQFCSLANAQEK